jgi:hypothetical protein
MSPLEFSQEVEIMKALIKKILVVGGLSTLIYLLISPSVAQANPVCYMINGSGQMIDLSHLCQPNIRTNTTENRAYFSQKVTENNQPSEPVRTYADIQNISISDKTMTQLTMLGPMLNIIIVS